MLPRGSNAPDDSIGTFSKGLGHAREGVLDAGAGLGCEHAVAPAAADARIAVRDAHADALLPAQDGADVELGTGLDQRVARIAGEELGALPPEDFGDDSSVLCFHLRS
jgi:hypothetical protein